MKILVTGVAGFIGYHLASNLIKNKKNTVVGLDSLNSYYDVSLKKKRLISLKKKNKYKNLKFFKLNLVNYQKIRNLFIKNKFDIIINLAAQAGVRYSLINPRSYLENNLIGFFNILDLSREFKVKHLISASTSSVYGESKEFPLSVKMPADHPIQFYAATKRSNEIMAYSYSKIHNLPITMLRFFTVYGPWGRPDMALFLFVKNTLKNKSIEVFNYGNHARDFTFIDDIIKGIILTTKKIPKKNFLDKNNYSIGDAPFKILNLGNGKKVSLIKYINEIEKNLNKKAKIKYLKMQVGDIKETHSDISDTKKYLKNYRPKVNVSQGVAKFIKWYKKYYKI